MTKAILPTVCEIELVMGVLVGTSPARAAAPEVTVPVASEGLV